ncbi:unnamed protein product [Heligmosomoides polygyrus]|uniref:Uncharacterized protein n=1 Tax=Heligmosomoides polygyrus TaxID=6339 RepID=A0A183FHD8_HELPZ|nr:unnamed protein product [Heligmosomoides polygyrus]
MWKSPNICQGFRFFFRHHPSVAESSKERLRSASQGPALLPRAGTSPAVLLQAISVNERPHRKQDGGLKERWTVEKDVCHAVADCDRESMLAILAAIIV